LKKELSPPAIAAIAVAVVALLGFIGYMMFRPEPTLYMPELLTDGQAPTKKTK
jgi:hypothetical protein